jgi:hypothetical protein
MKKKFIISALLLGSLATNSEAVIVTVKGKQIETKTAQPVSEAGALGIQISKIIASDLTNELGGVIETEVNMGVIGQDACSYKVTVKHTDLNGTIELTPTNYFLSVDKESGYKMAVSYTVLSGVCNEIPVKIYTPRGTISKIGTKVDSLDFFLNYRYSDSNKLAEGSILTTVKKDVILDVEVSVITTATTPTPPTP